MYLHEEVGVSHWKTSVEVDLRYQINCICEYSYKVLVKELVQGTQGNQSLWLKLKDPK